MSNTIRVLLFITLLGMFDSCSPSKRITTITSSSYDKNKNITTYIVLPYGSVYIPGKWTETRYNSSSRQQYFKKDSATLSVAIGPAAKIEFNKQGLKGYPLVKGFYEWESQYQVNQLHLQVELLKKDSVTGYYMWRVHSGKVNTFQLFAGVDCNCATGGGYKTLTLTATGMTNEVLANLLETIYLQKLK
ncbi:MAG: hypothetical protein H7257_13380 [Taibaiella sp.]|nr:hypothetical protein [Taibaiella sp.]